MAGPSSIVERDGLPRFISVALAALAAFARAVTHERASVELPSARGDVLYSIMNAMDEKKSADELGIAEQLVTAFAHGGTILLAAVTGDPAVALAGGVVAPRIATLFHRSLASRRERRARGFVKGLFS